MASSDRASRVLAGACLMVVVSMPFVFGCGDGDGTLSLIERINVTASTHTGDQLSDPLPCIDINDEYMPFEYAKINVTVDLTADAGSIYLSTVAHPRFRIYLLEYDGGYPVNEPDELAMIDMPLSSTASSFQHDFYVWCEDPPCHTATNGARVCEFKGLHAFPDSTHYHLAKSAGIEGDHIQELYASVYIYDGDAPFDYENPLDHDWSDNWVGFIEVECLNCF